MQCTTIVSRHKYPWYIWLFAATIFFTGLSILPEFSAALYLKKAEREIKAQNISKSIELYSKVLSIAPNCQEAKIGIACALFLTKSQTNHERALMHLKNVTIPSSYWQKLKFIIPTEHRSYFIAR